MKRVAWLLLAASGCTCIDVDKTPARYACSRDAGDQASECPGMWRCGLDGFCFDPSVGAPLACADSQTDCGGGWHCGATGTCYDRRDAGAVECRADAGDCADGWRCGLEGTCHDTATGAPYRCASDLDCEQLWRCGPDGRCVDGRLEGLRATPAGDPSLSPLSDHLPPSPDLVAAGVGTDLRGCFPAPTFVRAATAVYGQRMIHQLSFPYGHVTECLPDGGAGVIVPRLRFETQLPEAPLAVVDNVTRVYVLGKSGKINLYELDGGFASVSPTFSVRGLKANGDQPGLWAFDEARVARYDGTSWSYSLAAPWASDGGEHINDVEPMPLWSAAVLQPQLVVGTNRALWALQADLDIMPLDAWQWSRTQPGDCEDFINLSFEHLAAFSDSSVNWRLAADVLTAYANDSQRTVETVVLSLTRDGGFGYAGIRCPAELTHLGVYIARTESGCGSSGCEVLRDSRVEPALDGGSLVAYRCALRDGGFPSTVTCHTCPGSACSGKGFTDDNDPQPLDRHAHVSRSSSGMQAIVDDHGLLWFSTGYELQYLPDELHGVPVAVAGPLGGLEIENPTPHSGKFLTHDFVTLTLGSRLGDAGFMVNGTYGAHYQAAVAGRPEWVALSTLEVPFGIVNLYGATPGVFGDRPFRFLVHSPAPLDEPVRAASAPLADGGVLVLVSSRDVLSAADVTDVSDDPPQRFGTAPELSKAPRLAFAATPLPHADIVSLVGVAPSADVEDHASYALGYLVAAGRLFRFRADNPVVWRTDELVVTPAEAVAVWADGNRVRAAFRDGQVFSLPARVPLAPAVQPGASTVLDFAAAGCHTFALTTTGLYRLTVSPGSALGAWQHVKLLSENEDLSWAKGRLYSDGRALAVFRDFGTAERVDVPACP